MSSTSDADYSSPADLLQRDEEEDVEDTDELRKDEAEDVEEETLSVIKNEERRQETWLWPQFWSNFRFKHRNVHDQPN